MQVLSVVYKATSAEQQNVAGLFQGGLTSSFLCTRVTVQQAPTNTHLAYVGLPSTMNTSTWANVIKVLQIPDTNNVQPFDSFELVVQKGGNLIDISQLSVLAYYDATGPVEESLIITVYVA